MLPLQRFDAEQEAARSEPFDASQESLRMGHRDAVPPEDIYVAASFQKTSSVTIDLTQAIEPNANFFYVDTDVLFEQSYATRDALAERYGIEFQRFSGISLEMQEKEHGASLWLRQPDACCGIRKVEPMEEALNGADCWVSGIRRAGLAFPCRRKQVRLGQAFRALEVEPARGLDRRRNLEPPPGEPSAL